MFRFQQTVQSLEEEGNAEKHQLVAMHQQRVMAHINQRKKEAMACYTQALDDSPINVRQKTVTYLSKLTLSSNCSVNARILILIHCRIRAYESLQRQV